MKCRMHKKNAKRGTKVLAVLLMLAISLTSALSLASCAKANVGKPLMTLENYSISENMFQLLLSRVKGNLAGSGYAVTGSDWWDTIVIKEGQVTRDLYTQQTVLVNAKEYLAAAVLFDELGLSFSDGDNKKIDNEIQELIDNRAGGSKSELNRILSSFGANTDILRALYVIEAKYDKVRVHLYGTDASKVDSNIIQSYLEENAVCFRQILIRSYGYKYEQDTNGDDIYYLPSESGSKVSHIAYDTVGGTRRLDAFGKTVVDKNGDDVYYTPGGLIAYDKENGVRALAYDKDGNPQTFAYSSEVLAEHREAAEELLAKAAAAGPAGFEALMTEYSEAGGEEYVTDGKLCFLYTTGGNGYEYQDTMADELAKMKTGDATCINTEYGYHVIMRYDMPADAATNTEYQDWFIQLPDRVVNQLFQEKCAPYVEKIVVDNDRFAALPSMKDIGVNYYY